MYLVLFRMSTFKVPNNSIHTGVDPCENNAQQDGIPMTHRGRNPECSESERHEGTPLPSKGRETHASS